MREEGFATSTGFAVCVLVLASAAASVQAGSQYWQYDPLSSGSWFVTGNWNTAVPTSSDKAYVDNGGTALLSDAAQTARAAETYIGYLHTGAVVQDKGTASLGYMYLGQKAGSLGTYTLRGTGTLNASWLHLGGRSEGHVYHSAGTANIGCIVAGWNEGYEAASPGTNGVYELSGTASLVSQIIELGTYGPGSLVQTAGSVRATDDVWLKSKGLYQISGGTMTANRLVTNPGSRFVQSGGTVTIASRVYQQAGTYELSGFGTLTGEYEELGWDGSPCQFLQSGGTHSASFIRQYPGSMYRLTGGTLRIRNAAGFEGTVDFGGAAAALTVEAGGFVNLATGTVLGTSHATLWGGAGSLIILPAGTDPASDFGSCVSSGLVHVSGNVLTIPPGMSIRMFNKVDEHVVVAGTVTGSPTVPALNVLNMTRGLEVLPGGKFCTADSRCEISIEDTTSGISGGQMYSHQEHVGKAGTGAFTQTDGLNHSDNAVNLGYLPGSRGTYSISGGQLVAQSGVHVGVQGTGQLVQTGGSIQGSLYVGEQGDGTYQLSGTGQVQGWELRIGIAAQGSVRQTGGSITLNYNSSIYNSNLWLSRGTYEMLGGQLTAYGEAIGEGGTALGTFRQSGGTNTATKYMDIGQNEGRRGLYELSGTGQLIAPELAVGRTGIGTLTQTGGQVQATTSLIVGKESRANGTYTISGGSLTTPQLYVGGPHNIYSPNGKGKLEILGAAPSITVSSKLYFGKNGTLVCSPGATIHMTRSGLENWSTDPAALGGLANLALVFEGGAGVTDPFEVAGIDRQGEPYALENNFTLGTLQLGGQAGVGRVKLVDLFDNQPGWAGAEALYVKDLIVGAGSSLDLNGLDLYYLHLTLGQGATIVGGTPIQVPEPATILFLAAGALFAVARRRRPR